MSDYSVDSENVMLNALTVDTVSAHTGDPGASGTANEVTGGSPAYARKAITYGSSTTGVKHASSQPEFDIPGGSTVAYIGFWQGSAFRGSKAVTNKTDSAQWIYRLTTADLDIA